MLIIKTNDIENMTSDIDSVSSWKDFHKTFHFLRWAQCYFKKGLWKRHVDLHYHVQRCPHYGTQKAGYLIQAGSQSVLDFVRHGISQAQTRGSESESLLKSYHTGENKNRRVFSDEFLDWYFRQEWLSQFSMTAIPDGRVVHPGEPLFILEGSLPLVKALAKLISSIANLQIAAATRAARIRDAVRDQPIYVFVPSSWTINHNALYGAYAGGCSFLGGDESTAFENASPLEEVSQLLLSLDETGRNESQAYESFYPTEHQFCLKRNQDLNSVLPAVVKALKKLNQKKNKKLGVQLAGGDLVSASILLVKELLLAGLTDVRILVSQKFDEIRCSEFMGRIHEESTEKGIQPQHVIEKLMFLDSIEDSFLKEVTPVNGKWKVLLKKSDACSQIWRLYGPRKKARWDICTANSKNDLDPLQNLQVAAVNQPEKTYSIDKKISVSSMEPLLLPLVKEGKIVRSKISADDAVRMQDIHALNYESRQFINPGNYPVVRRLKAGVKSRTKRK